MPKAGGEVLDQDAGPDDAARRRLCRRELRHGKPALFTPFMPSSYSMTRSSANRPYAGRSLPRPEDTRSLTGHGEFVDDITRRSSFSHSGPFGTVAVTRGCATLWANVIIPWCRSAAGRGVTACSAPFCSFRLLPGHSY